MRVKCQGCSHQFEVPLQAAGAINYERCKNVFRVMYRFRTPCPECKQILQLVPAGPDEALGIPTPFPVEETTEHIQTSIPEDATLPATLAAPGPAPKPPTVRIGRPVPTAAKKFQMLERSLAPRPRALHVPVRSSKRNHGVFLKFLFGLGLGMCALLALTIAFAAMKPASLASLKNTLPGRSEPLPGETRPVLEEPKDKTAGEVPASQPTPRPLVTPSPKKKRPKRPQETVHLDLPDLKNLTSDFGFRKDPFTGKRRFHKGIDIKGKPRSEVRAAMEGKVRFAGWKRGYGYLVILDHKRGYQTVYGHLEKPLVKRGTRISEGEPIGLLGSTGRSTGPHVHFELRQNGKQIDPLRAQYLAKVPRRDTKDEIHNVGDGDDE